MLHRGVQHFAVAAPIGPEDNNDRVWAGAACANACLISNLVWRRSFIARTVRRGGGQREKHKRR